MDVSNQTVIFNEELCTVGSDHAVVSWVTNRPCPGAAVRFGEDPSRLDGVALSSGEKYHLTELNGLKPATSYWYRVESRGARGSLNGLTTLPAPPGRFLFRFGIVTDTHIAAGKAYDDPNRIFLGKLSEFAGTLLARSISDVKERKVDLVVFTGDFTDTGDGLQYADARSKLQSLGNTPRLLCIGNHDKFTRFGGVGERGFYEYLVDRDKGYQSVLFKEHRFLLLDSCRENQNKGYLSAGQLKWLDRTLEESGDRPAFVFLHHPSHGADLWFGLTNHQDLTGIIGRYPSVQGVFCGHMHRNKVTSGSGDVPYVEVPATVQYPCGYAVVRLFAHGFEYNAYKVSRIDLSEMSRERFILKNGGEALLSRYSFGNLGDRSFSRFGGRLYRPRSYELSVTLDDRHARDLYEQTQALDGASLTPAGTGTTRVVLGRFPTFESAQTARQRTWSRYGVQARVDQTATGPPARPRRSF